MLVLEKKMQTLVLGRNMMTLDLLELARKGPRPRPRAGQQQQEQQGQLQLPKQEPKQLQKKSKAGGAKTKAKATSKRPAKRTEHIHQGDEKAEQEHAMDPELEEEEKEVPVTKRPAGQVRKRPAAHEGSSSQATDDKDLSLGDRIKARKFKQILDSLPDMIEEEFEKVRNCRRVCNTLINKVIDRKGGKLEVQTRPVLEELAQRIRRQQKDDLAKGQSLIWATIEFPPLSGETIDMKRRLPTYAPNSQREPKHGGFLTN